MYEPEEHFGIPTEKMYRDILKCVKRNYKGLSRVFKRKITLEDAQMLDDVSISDTEIETLDFLKHFKNVKSVAFSNCGLIKNTDGLGYLTNLEYFMTYDTAIDNFEPLRNCRKMESFDYMVDKKEECKRDNFSFIKEYRDLVEVYLSGNNVTDVSFLAYNKNLVEIVLTDNPVTHLEALACLEKLNYLEVENCQLTSLRFAEDFSALTSFYASGNNLDRKELEYAKEKFSDIQNFEV